MRGTFFQSRDKSPIWTLRLSEIHLIKCIKINILIMFCNYFAKVAGCPTVAGHAVKLNDDCFGIFAVLSFIVIQFVLAIDELPFVLKGTLKQERRFFSTRLPSKYIPGISFSLLFRYHSKFLCCHGHYIVLFRCKLSHLSTY